MGGITGWARRCVLWQHLWLPARLPGYTLCVAFTHGLLGTAGSWRFGDIIAAKSRGLAHTQKT